VYRLAVLARRDALYNMVFPWKSSVLYTECFFFLSFSKTSMKKPVWVIWVTISSPPSWAKQLVLLSFPAYYVPVWVIWVTISSFPTWAIVPCICRTCCPWVRSYSSKTRVGILFDPMILPVASPLVVVVYASSLFL